MAKEAIDKETRNKASMALCKRLNCAPRHVFDLQMYVLFNTYYLVPQQLEKLLELRGHRVGDEESLFEKVEEVYGIETAKLALDLI